MEDTHRSLEWGKRVKLGIYLLPQSFLNHSISSSCISLPVATTLVWCVLFYGCHAEMWQSFILFDLSGSLSQFGLVKQQTFIFHSSGEAGKSKIKVPSIPYLARAHYLVCRWVSSPCILTWRAEKEKANFLVAFYKGTNPFIGALPSWFDYLPKSPPPNSSTLGLGFQYILFVKTRKCNPQT